MTTPPSELGYIMRELGKIGANVESMRSLMNEDRVDATKSRADTREQLQEMQQRISDLERTSNSNSKALNDEVLPTVKKVKIWEQRGIGFLAAAGMVGTGLGAALVGYADDVKRVLQNFFN